MISLTATSSVQSDITSDFPNAKPTHNENDANKENKIVSDGSKSNDNSTGLSSKQQGQIAAPVYKGLPIHQLYPQHQPITLVNGQRINQGFQKPEKTKWTAEEGAHSNAARITSTCTQGHGHSLRVAFCCPRCSANFLPLCFPTLFCRRRATDCCGQA